MNAKEEIKKILIEMYEKCGGSRYDFSDIEMEEIATEVLFNFKFSDIEMEEIATEVLFNFKKKKESTVRVSSITFGDNLYAKTNIPTKADNFAQTLKDNPKEIIEWAKREIAEYEKLIEIIKGGKK